MAAEIRPGTISHGTLRNEDLIPAFLEELRRVDPASAGQFTDDGDPRTDILWENIADIPDHLQEFASEMVSELIETLNDAAPEGMYFGALEGDASDFGFWESEWPDDDVYNRIRRLNMSDLELRMVSMALMEIVYAWREDPDSFGETDTDFRNTLVEISEAIKPKFIL